MININIDYARYHLSLLEPFQAAKLVLFVSQSKDIIRHYNVISKIKDKTLTMVLTSRPADKKLYLYGGLFFATMYSHELKNESKRYVHVRTGAGSTVITWYRSETEAVDDLRAKGYLISKGNTSKSNV